MALKKKKKKVSKPKRPAREVTLWGVILSYPDVHNPKSYKGKIYYRTDVLMDEDHPQLKQLRADVIGVKKEFWGEDKAEWPEATQNAGNKKLIFDGNEREDESKAYKERFYITAQTQTPVPVVDLKGKAFNAQQVKGGMIANVAVRITAWEYEGDQGVSIYLQGIQIDTTEKPLSGFGGGKSVEQMFGKKGSKSDSDDESDDDTDEDEEDKPRGKKGKKVNMDFDEEEEPSRKKKKAKKSSKSEEE